MTLRDRPIVCLVTDRRRFTDPAADAGALQGTFVALAREAAAAGVDLFQIREAGLETGPLVCLVRAVVEATRGSSMRVLVNDRVDIALTAGAAGVHLRGDSIQPVSARRLTPPDFLVGRSVHGIDEAREHAAAVDYLIAGTVFPTASKASGTTLLGLHGLRDIAAAVAVPVLAIGGVTVDRVADVAAAGAAGFAAIGLFLKGPRPLADAVAAARAQFDSLGTAS